MSLSQWPKMFYRVPIVNDGLYLESTCSVEQAQDCVFLHSIQDMVWQGVKMFCCSFVCLFGCLQFPMMS